MHQMNHGAGEGAGDGQPDHGNGTHTTDGTHADGHRHSHAISAEADRRWLGLALCLIFAFMIGEVIVGVAAHSLALLSDAAHMLTDAGAIVLALVAMRVAGSKPRGGYTFGLQRAEIVSALVNGMTMLLLAAWLCYEAVLRLISPPAVAGLAVLLTALVGIVVNILATRAISRANRTSLNVRGAYLHILTDLFAFIATAVAGLVMMTTGFTRADGIATLAVVVLMVKAGFDLVRECGRIFLEGAPTGVDPSAIGRHLAEMPGVVEVHDLHIWQITADEPALSAHVLVAVGCDCHMTCAAIERLLDERYGIRHSTLQVDHAGPGQDPVTRCGEASQRGERTCEPHGATYRSRGSERDPGEPQQDL